MKTVPLYGSKAAGRVALVDDEDYAMVMAYRWQAAPRGRVLYARTSKRVNGRQYFTYMHTLIAGWPETDHRNHDGLDNQRSNLRPASRAQNNANQHPRSGGTSRFKGVSWSKDKRKWRARIKADGREHQLGRFANEEDAARAYDSAALAAFGEYAFPNFPVPESRKPWGPVGEDWRRP
jgi:hypothetical protein